VLWRDGPFEAPRTDSADEFGTLSNSYFDACRNCVPASIKIAIFCPSCHYLRYLD